jgi:hypothetical protein
MFKRTDVSEIIISINLLDSLRCVGHQTRKQWQIKINAKQYQKDKQIKLS